MGLPPFGPFTGFMAQAMDLPLAAWGGLAVVLGVSLVPSWYVIGMVHRVLFGPERPELAQTDLVLPEVVALTAYVCMLAAVGIVPGGVLARTGPSTIATVVIDEACFEEATR